MYIGGWWVSGSHLADVAKLGAREDVFQGHAKAEHGKETFTYERTLTQHFKHTEGNATKGLVSNLNVKPSPIFCRLNYHVRDQNYRKYFAHRERRGADLFTGKPLSK
jgi:hypothetical protein